MDCVVNWRGRRGGLVIYEEERDEIEWQFTLKHNQSYDHPYLSLKLEEKHENGRISIGYGNKGGTSVH